MPIMRRKIQPDSIVYTDCRSSCNALDISEFKHYRMGHDNLSMCKNMLKCCYDNKKQACNSFPHFREEIQANN